MRYRMRTLRKGGCESMGWRQTWYWEPPAPDASLDDPAMIDRVGRAVLCSPKVALRRAWAEGGLDEESMTPSEWGEPRPDCTWTHGYRFANKLDLGTDEIQLYAGECGLRVSLVPVGSELSEGDYVLTVLPREAFRLSTDLPMLGDPDGRLHGSYVGIAFRWLIVRRGMTFSEFMGRSHMLKRARGILYGTGTTQDRNRRFAYVEHIAGFLGYWVALRPIGRRMVPGEIEVDLVTPERADQGWFDEGDDREIPHYPQVYEGDGETTFVFRAPTRVEEAVEALAVYGLGLYVAPIGSDGLDDGAMVRCEEALS